MIMGTSPLESRSISKSPELGMSPNWEYSAQPFTSRWDGPDIGSGRGPFVLQRSGANTTFRRKTPSSSCRTTSEQAQETENRHGQDQGEETEEVWKGSSSMQALWPVRTSSLSILPLFLRLDL